MKVRGTGLVISLLLLSACGSREAAGGRETAASNSNGAAAPASSPLAANSDNGKPAQTGQSTSAASLYREQNCHTCHGSDGKGLIKSAPDFTDASWQKQVKDDELISAIKNGRPPMMPAFGRSLNDEQIKLLVGYVRSLGKK